jgi:hypothetical protein
MDVKITAPSSGDFDILYFPGGKRPPVILDGYDFIMAIRPLQGRELDSVALAKRLRLQGTQGLGPFFARIDRALRELDPPRALAEFVKKKSVAGKPTFWKILKPNKSAR